jgi:hypothetical protein
MILTGAGIIDSRRQVVSTAANYVANNGTYYWSPDGFTWNTGSGQNFFSPTQIAWNGTFWLAGGVSGSGNTTVLTKSTNGKTWTLQSPPFVGCTQVIAIIWDSAKWMIGTNAGVYYSFDGSNWTYANIAHPVRRLIYTGSTFIAIGSTMAQISVSTNGGLNWTTRANTSFTGYASVSPQSGFWDGTNIWLLCQMNGAAGYSAYRSAAAGSTWFATTTANTVFSASGLGGMRQGIWSGTAVNLGFGLTSASPNMVGKSTSGATTWSATVGYPGGFGANGFINDGFYDGTKFLVITKSSTLPIAYSYDGTTWYSTTGVSANTGLTFGGIASKTNKSVNPKF